MINVVREGGWIRETEMGFTEVLRIRMAEKAGTV